MGQVGLTLFGYTFTDQQIELIQVVFGCLFGALLVWGVVTKATKLIVFSALVVAVVLAWYGVTHGWFDTWLDR
ncbi:MAG: hypothetical protein R2737_07740 [Candidatus Nanopelagicales bacterium]